MENTADSEARTVDERLSLLVDGELDAPGVDAVCAAWRDDTVLRAQWHGYHLIGDVLRSDELAASPVRDAALLRGLRARLAQEPVVFAPEPLMRDQANLQEPMVSNGAARRRRWRWMAPSAVAAGFMAVSGVMLVSRTPAPSPGGAPVLAQSPAEPQVLAGRAADSAAAGLNSPQPAAAVMANGRLMRDANLDKYLAAHQQFSTTSALGAPSGFLRNAAADVSER